MAMMVMVIMTNQNVTVDKMQEAYLFTLSLCLILFQASRQHDNISSHFSISSGRTLRTSRHYAMCVRDQWWCCGPRRDAADGRSV